jgi:hypothetical protein
MLTLSCGAKVSVDVREIRIEDILPGGVYANVRPAKVLNYGFLVTDACIVITAPSDCDKLIMALQELKESILKGVM